MPFVTSADQPPTIMQLFLAAAADKAAADRSGQKRPFCLQVAADGRTIEFFPPHGEHAGPQRGWDLLRSAVQASVRQPSPKWRLQDAEVEQVGRHMLALAGANATQPPGFEALATLARVTQDKLKGVKEYVAQVDALLPRLMAGPAGSSVWHSIAPAAPLTGLLARDARLGESTGYLTCVDGTYTLYVLEQILTGAGDALTDVEKNGGIGRLADPESEPLQHAFAETCLAVLEGPAATGRQGALADVPLVRLLRYVPHEAFESMFLSRAAFERLRSAQQVAPTLVGLPPLAGDDPRFQAVARNMERYEACKAAGAMPASLAEASRRFAVEMFERLQGRFTPVPAPAQGAFLDRTARHLSGREFEHLKTIASACGLADLIDVPEATRQMLFGATCAGSLLQAALCMWNEATDGQKTAMAVRLMRADEKDVRHIYIEQSVLQELRACTRKTAGELRRSTCDEAAKKNLGILEENSHQWENFRRSGLYGHPDFIDVDRVLLVPWWRAMQKLLAARERAGETAQAAMAPGDSAVVVHAAALHARCAQQPLASASAPPSASPTPLSSAETNAAHAQEPTAASSSGAARAPGRTSPPMRPAIPAHAHLPLTPNTNRAQPGPTGHGWWDDVKHRSNHHVAGTQAHLPKWMRDLFGGRKGKLKENRQAVAENRAPRTH